MTVDPTLLSTTALCVTQPNIPENDYLYVSGPREGSLQVRIIVPPAVPVVLDTTGLRSPFKLLGSWHWYNKLSDVPSLDIDRALLTQSTVSLEVKMTTLDGKLRTEWTPVTRQCLMAP